MVAFGGSKACERCEESNLLCVPWCFYPPHLLPGSQRLEKCLGCIRVSKSCVRPTTLGSYAALLNLPSEALFRAPTGPRLARDPLDPSSKVAAVVEAASQPPPAAVEPLPAPSPAPSSVSTYNLRPNRSTATFSREPTVTQTPAPTQDDVPSVLIPATVPRRSRPQPPPTGPSDRGRVRTPLPSPTPTGRADKGKGRATNLTPYDHSPPPSPVPVSPSSPGSPPPPVHSPVPSPAPSIPIVPGARLPVREVTPERPRPTASVPSFPTGSSGRLDFSPDTMIRVLGASAPLVREVAEREVDRLMDQVSQAFVVANRQHMIIQVSLPRLSATRTYTPFSRASSGSHACSARCDRGPGSRS